MDGRGFRLQQMKVEGFKGFTASKTIAMDAKHLFILGPNSYGKSSIIEAIRWGLFGSTRRPGEVVSNQGYAGSCRVELLLERSGDPWTLKRTLIRGVSGGSDADIVDKHGQSHLLRDVLPQLESTPAGEGMHIIYAAQSAPLRRPAEDISSFERTIYSYLGLTDVRIAISRFESFIEMHEITERELAQEVDEKRNSIESDLSQLTEQWRRIIENPPWGSGNVPTQADTVDKIHVFIKELSTALPAEAASEVEMELSLLIKTTEILLDRTSHTKRSEVEAKLREIERRLTDGHSLSTQLTKLVEDIEQVNNKSTSIEKNLADILAGKSIDMLAKAIKNMEQRIEKFALLHDLRNKACIWLERNLKSSGIQHCPVCNVELQSRELLSDLKNMMQDASSKEVEAVNQRDAINLKYQEASHLSEQLNELKNRNISLQQQSEQVIGKVLDFLGPGYEQRDGVSAIQKCLNELTGTKMILEKSLQETTELQQEWKRKLDRLQEEIRFHRTQEQLLKLRKQQQQFTYVEDELKTLTFFGDSVRKITIVLKDALNNMLKKTLPGINEKLSKAFLTLTEHPAYNRVFIDESRLPKLELLVASEDAPQPGWQPSEVLNGQALSALELVPYFAFSELTDVPFEVYLLILDDPTQSFDKHHIDILFAKLAELGKRIQLVIASHEVDHLNYLLPQYFGSNDYKVVRVTSFSRKDGPTLEM